MASQQICKNDQLTGYVLHVVYKSSIHVYCNAKSLNA